MNPARKRASPPPDENATTASKKPRIVTTPSGIALPQKTRFDPWNSSSTGHQRAENNLAGSTSWRGSRNLKLEAQYQGGRGGGKRLADTVGAGSEAFGKDGRKANGSWRDGAKGLRDTTQKSIKDALSTEKTRRGQKGEDEQAHASLLLEKHQDEPEDDVELRRAIAASVQEATHPHASMPEPDADANADADLERALQASMVDDITTTTQWPNSDVTVHPPSNQADYHDTTQAAEEASILANPDDLSRTAHQDQPKHVFHNLVFYINGSTAPLISDHRLKYLISSHGGHLSISHARKQVTHVIIGNPHSHTSSTGRGTGGALASTKIQKEVLRHRGKGVKFVGAQWILDSVAAGKRMAEARYENVKLGGAGQGSVFDAFKNAKPGSSTAGLGKARSADLA